MAQLFTCALCRSHFLDTYNSCAFGRCAGEKEEGQGQGRGQGQGQGQGQEGQGEGADIASARLQLWLFRVHNAVTARIYKEHGAGLGTGTGTAAGTSTAAGTGTGTGSGNAGALVSSPEQFREVLWPEPSVPLGASDGPRNIVEPSLVLAYLRQAYWDEEQWGQQLRALPSRLALQALV